MTKDEYARGGEIYEELFKEKDDRKEEENTIKIAGRGIEIYNQTILNKLQKFDQIVICVQDNHLERALHIIKLWDAIGIVPIKGKIVFEKREEDIVTRDGKKITRPVNRITLTKQPEQFRFTKDKKVV